jgi:hypothetical protein
MSDSGGVAWDIDQWNFLLNGKDYDSIHPSVQRQATLNMEYGLFEVVPGIYHVRGFDLAHISFNLLYQRQDGMDRHRSVDYQGNLPRRAQVCQ